MERGPLTWMRAGSGAWHAATSLRSRADRDRLCVLQHLSCRGNNFSVLIPFNQNCASRAGWAGADKVSKVMTGRSALYLENRTRELSKTLGFGFLAERDTSESRSNLVQILYKY